MSITTSIWDATRQTVANIKSYLGGDGKLDLEPSTSEVYDVRATDHNKIVAGLSEVAARTIYGNIINLHFSAPNVAAGATNTAMYRGSGADTALTEFYAPAAGWVVGLSVTVENARTAGTCTINMRSDDSGGTPYNSTLSVAIDGTNDQYYSAIQNSYDAGTNDAFAAGDKITCVYTTDGAWAAGATPSVGVDMIIALGV